MQTEETKDNGAKAEGTDFGCCNPENFQKMFEKMGKCFLQKEQEGDTESTEKEG
jgi:hypothetical protein